MTPEQVREQMARLEGFSQGIKNGMELLGNWVITTLQAEQTKQTPPPIIVEQGDSNGPNANR